MTRPTIRSSQPTGRDRDRGFWRTLAFGLGVSVVFHGALALLPPLDVELPPHLQPADRITLLAPPEERTPPDVDVPAPPEAVTRPEEPEVSASGEPVAGDDGPEFIPHDVRPRFLNPEQVQEYLRVYYPVTLRVAAIEGAVHLWLYVDQSGRVTKVQVRESSGSPQFDALARSAAPFMKFRPALNQGDTVGVWVSIWVRFDLQEPAPAATDERLVGGTGDENR